VSPTFGCWAKTSKNAGRFIVMHRRKPFKVATLVCSAFHGSRPEGMVVSHLDENSRNNKPDNLKWDTQKNNLNMPKIKQYHRQTCSTKMKGVSIELSNS
jgi:hypothetical protein